MSSSKKIGTLTKPKLYLLNADHLNNSGSSKESKNAQQVLNQWLNVGSVDELSLVGSRLLYRGLLNVNLLQAL